MREGKYGVVGEVREQVKKREKGKPFKAKEHVVASFSAGAGDFVP